MYCTSTFSGEDGEPRPHATRVGRSGRARRTRGDARVAGAPPRRVRRLGGETEARGARDTARVSVSTVVCGDGCVVLC